MIFGEQEWWDYEDWFIAHSVQDGPSSDIMSFRAWGDAFLQEPNPDKKQTKPGPFSQVVVDAVRKGIAAASSYVGGIYSRCLRMTL